MSESTIQRIVLTGSAGFIATSLGPYLCDRGYEVIGVDNFKCGYEENMAWSTQPSPNGCKRSFTFVRASASDDAVTALLRRGDIVIHLGAYSCLASNQVNPRDSYANNVASTAGLLNACRVAGVKHFIFASTSAIYENTPTKPTHENDEVSPNLIYSLGKKHCEDLVHSFHQIYELPFTILRFFNVFGPHQDALRTQPPLVPYLIDCLSKGTVPVLHSDGSQARDYVYVKDLLRLVGRVLDVGPLNTEINVCSGKTTTVREMVSHVQRVLGVTTEPIYRDPSLLWDKTPALFQGVHPFPKSRMCEEVLKFSLGDASKAKALLGWETEFDAESGIKDILGKL
jgi:UDP-glucose 4-epimerase